MARGEDTRNHPNRGVGRTEMRSMTKDTLQGLRQQGYGHPTGPTMFLGDKGASAARSYYRQYRQSGETPQYSRDLAIRMGMVVGRDSVQGSLGYGNH